jgi:NADPH-dependent 2,4-dienoyl-CoA reductase/sulfur reductase-like enzyme
VGKWVPLEYSAVKTFEPEKNLLYTEDGNSFSYDHLIIASGIKTDFDKIKG